MDIHEITTSLTRWQQDVSLWAENNLAARMKALADVAQQPWLQCLDRARLHQFKLAVFKSSRCFGS